MSLTSKPEPSYIREWEKTQEIKKAQRLAEQKAKEEAETAEQVRRKTALETIQKALTSRDSSLKFIESLMDSKDPHAVKDGYAFLRCLQNPRPLNFLVYEVSKVDLSLEVILIQIKACF